MDRLIYTSLTAMRGSMARQTATANNRYTGKGEIARASKQGWLQKFFSIISPF